MPTPTKAATARTKDAGSKPSTRGSIRHSLNLASMGKALAEVMSKDSSDRPSKKVSAAQKDSKAKARDKAQEKEKDQDLTATRRLSAIHIGAPRQSMGSVREKEKEKPNQLSVKSKKDSPDTKTISRTTRSMARKLAEAAASHSSTSEESASHPPAGHPPAIMPSSRSATLRPRQNAAATKDSASSASASASAYSAAQGKDSISALPKYRPRSMLVEANNVPNAKKPQQPPSPARPGTRRRLDSTSSASSFVVDSIADARHAHAPDLAARSISPLPRRTGLRGTQNQNQPPVPVFHKPLPRAESPARPAKAAKGSTSAIPRPPSASSSSVLASPRTPKQTPAFKTANSTPSSTPSRKGTLRQPGTAALSRGKATSSNTPTSTDSDVGTATTFTTVNSTWVEGNSTDSAGDVEMMLASFASPTAPTPALPRIRRTAMQTFGPSKAETPSRPQPGAPPARAHLSYLSPDPGSSPRLRPGASHLAANASTMRGSILSWEQLAADDHTLGRGEIDTLLAEVPAPFRSAAPSPSLSTPTASPSSPALSVLPSPGEYGSISQVILPDMTPSPAPAAARDVFHRQGHGDTLGVPSPMDGGTATLLRLQLASVEAQAAERLAQVRHLEEQLRMATQARARDVAELEGQMNELEEQLHTSMQARNRADDERGAYVTGLEEQLHAADEARERAVAQASEHARAEAVTRQQKRCEAACRAQEIAGRWAAVREIADGELELVRSSKETLGVLLTQMNALLRTKRTSCT